MASKTALILFFEKTSGQALQFPNQKLHYFESGTHNSPQHNNNENGTNDNDDDSK